MSNEGVVTISADELLKIADKLKEVEKDLRKIGLKGFGTQPIKQTPQKQKPEMEPMPLAIEILGLDWKKRARDGGGPAGPDTPWCWTYAYPNAHSHEPSLDRHDLVKAILQFGVVQCGKYIVKLSGRDMRLLNRTFA